MVIHPDTGVDIAIHSGNLDRAGNPSTEGIGPVWYDATRRGAQQGEPNGNLRDQLRENSHGIDLWINKFSADFAITGMSAQSHQKRDFYPRFFSQPAYHVEGQCATNADYNRIARYVRDSHINTVTGNVTTSPLILTLAEDPYQVGRNTKGGNSAWILTGYIKTITAGAVRFVQAPTFAFDFTVVDVRTGMLRDLDQMALVAHSGSEFISQFGPSEQFPNVKVPAPWGADGTKPKKPPTTDNIHDSHLEPTNTNPITATIPDFTTGLFANLFTNDQ